MRDIYNNLKIEYSINQLVTADTNGTGVDLRDYDGAIVQITAHQPVATVSSAAAAQAWSSARKMDFKLQESNDNTNWTNVADSDMQGSIATSATSGSASQTQEVGYLGGKRYIRVQADISGSWFGGVTAAVILGYATRVPVTK